MKYSTMIFDMDGVIVDSEQHWSGEDLAFLQSLIPEYTEEDYEHLTGMSLGNVYGMLRSRFTTPLSEEDFFARYEEMAQQVYSKKANLLPGVVAVLKQLQTMHLPIGLASSSNRSWINIVLDRFSVHTYFKATVSAQEIEGDSKPAPDIYLHTANQLGVQPTECVVIEDSTKGIASAKAAGMYCIGLRNGMNDKQNLERADIIINSFENFPFELF